MRVVSNKMAMHKLKRGRKQCKNYVNFPLNDQILYFKYYRR